MPTPTTFEGLVNGLLGIINILIPAILGVIFLFLVWKIIDSWVINAGDEKKREEGKQYAIVATIVMVLMMVVWGIVAVLRASVFGF
jgi:uncharacterized membrane-anchored protein